MDDQKRAVAQGMGILHEGRQNAPSLVPRETVEIQMMLNGEFAGLQFRHELGIDGQGMSLDVLTGGGDVEGSPPLYQVVKVLQHLLILSSQTLTP